VLNYLAYWLLFINVAVYSVKLASGAPKQNTRPGLHNCWDHSINRIWNQSSYAQLHLVMLLDPRTQLCRMFELAGRGQLAQRSHVALYGQFPLVSITRTARTSFQINCFIGRIQFKTRLIDLAMKGISWVVFPDVLTIREFLHSSIIAELYRARYWYRPCSVCRTIYVKSEDFFTCYSSGIFAFTWTILLFQGASAKGLGVSDTESNKKVRLLYLLNLWIFLNRELRSRGWYSCLALVLDFVCFCGSSVRHCSLGDIR